MRQGTLSLFQGGTALRTSGFPCRFGGCERSYPVEDQSSMAALTAASAARSAHEIADHQYHHATLPEAPRLTSYRSIRRPKEAPGSAPA